MHDYKAKINRKKARGSQTAGRTKGGTCQASAQDRYMAGRSRSYKHRDFAAYSAKVAVQANR